ncbi:MAG: serine/threonine-protein kinase [Acidobacteriota bacterium]
MQHPTRVGKYKIDAFLGGGMSHVYRAIDPVLQRTVAVKVMTEQALIDAEARGKFLQEARIAALLEHENIIRILDFGEECREDEAPRPYMVLEYVEGESLRKTIQDKRTGSTAQKLRIALQGAKALAYVHSRQIVHRDIKPENLHMERGGKVRLMDFGVAKSISAEAQSGAASEAGATAIGTPFYMAPEQVLGREPTNLTDIYAFGLMAYELFTGERPVPGKTVDEIFHHILYDPLNEEPWTAAGVPQVVQELFARCTNKQLAQRPQSMDEICEEIEKCLAPPTKPTRIDSSTQPEMVPGVLSSSYQRPEPTLRLRMPPRPGLSAEHTAQSAVEVAKPAAAQAAPDKQPQALAKVMA